jgi:hypothetical protein
MTITEAPPISIQHIMGEEMSYITFAELVKEITGSPFEEVYKDYLIHGANNEQGNLE